MKRLIIALLVLIPVMTFAQKNHRLDSIWIPTGTDTTYYIMLYSPEPVNISISYKQLSCVDATFNIGESPHPDSLIFNQLVNTSLPYTMADSTVAFEKPAFNSEYTAFKVTKGSCSAGETILLWITTNEKFTYIPGTTKIIR